MTEIIVSKKNDEDPDEISTLNITEKSVIELEFDDESISYTTRNLFWDRKVAKSPIKFKKALSYAEIGMGANIRVFQFY